MNELEEYVGEYIIDRETVTPNEIAEEFFNEEKPELNPVIEVLEELDELGVARNLNDRRYIVANYTEEFHDNFVKYRGELL